METKNIGSALDKELDKSVSLKLFNSIQRARTRSKLTRKILE